jgi:predicted RNA-binding protein with TRAM domain
MARIPDSLRSVFSATVQEQDGTYVLEIPAREIDYEAVTLGEIYRVAMLPSLAGEGSRDEASSGSPRSGDAHEHGPPVEEGEVREVCEVTVETLGEQGDGIDDVRRNVAFASVVKPDPRSL